MAARPMVIDVLCGVYGALLLFKAVMASWEVRRQRRAGRHAREGRAEVTVLQAILSGDPNLERVLEDNLRNLSGAQFLWLIDRDDGEARAVAVRLLARNPHSRVSVMECPECPAGVNPKVFKLDMALSQVRSEVLLVLDDDSRLYAEGLEELLCGLDSAELCTALPCYRDDRRLATRLLGQFVNNNAALTYLPLLPAMSPVTINGMCYGLRCDYLRSLGGFGPIRHVLTDDLAMAELVRSHGGRIRQSIAMVEVQTTLRDMKQYVRQMHRWYLFALLLFRRQGIALNIVLGVLYAAHPLVLWGILVWTALHPSVAGLSGLVALLALRALVPGLLQKTLTGRVRMRPLTSILSELAQPFHFLHALCCRTIRWRSRRYRVRSNDAFVPCP
jgi:ceramide glucosyltransferase